MGTSKVSLARLQELARIAQPNGTAKLDLEMLGFAAHFLRRLSNPEWTAYVLEHIERPITARELSDRFLADQAMAEAHLMDLVLHGLLKIVLNSNGTTYTLTDDEPWHSLAIRFWQQAKAAHLLHARRSIPLENS